MFCICSLTTRPKTCSSSPQSRSREPRRSIGTRRSSANSSARSPGSVAAAARSVGRSARSAYRLRTRPGAESFAAAWDAAQSEAAQRAWDVVVERGFAPMERPVFHRGRRIGTRQHYDNRLLTSALFAQDRAADRLAASHQPSPESMFVEAMARPDRETKRPNGATQCPDSRDLCDASPRPPPHFVASNPPRPTAMNAPASTDAAPSATMPSGSISAT